MTLTDTQRAWQCATCDTTGRRGYCAPNVCVCGHPTCHAYASFVPRRPTGDLHLLPFHTPVENAGGFSGNAGNNSGTTIFDRRTDP